MKLKAPNKVKAAPTESISLRLEQVLLERLRAECEAAGINLSEGVRQLITQGLKDSTYE